MSEYSKDQRLAAETIYMLDRQLKTLLKRDSISVIKLAKATGINAKTIYNYLDGRSPRNLDHVRILCQHFKVSSDFLLFDIGSTKPGDSKSVSFSNLEELVQFGRFDVFLKRVDQKDKK